MEITVDYLKTAINNALNTDIRPNNTCLPVTVSINAEYALGRYNALIDLLQVLDLDAFIEVHEAAQPRIKELMNAVESLYKKGA